MALQMGSEVNYNELSGLIGINKITGSKIYRHSRKGLYCFQTE